MKKLFLVAAAAVFALSANAKVWRINYDENANADFRTITAACSSSKVANTDTLYCEAGNHYGSADDNVISRPGLKVFGPGWGFEPQYGNTSTIADARFSAQVRINANNVYVSGIVANGDLYLKSNSNAKRGITIDRCKINSFYVESRDTLSNVTIKNCYLGRIHLYGISQELKNWYIINNIIEKRYVYPYYNAIRFEYIGNDIVSNFNILHNTIVFIPYNTSNAPIDVHNSLIQDNIIINPDNHSNVLDFSTNRGNIIRKNVFSMSGGDVEHADIIANFPDNYYVEATEAGTFTCTKSTFGFEQYFQLKDGSPAKNAAYDGGDCGAFGGSTPYIIGGRPQGIPYITDVEVPAQPKDNKLTVTFKVANQNE